MVLLDHSDLRRYEIHILEGLGVPSDQAEIVVDNLVEADLRGVDSHGAHLIELYVDRLRSGHLRPVTEVEVVRDDGATVMMEGGIGFGQGEGTLILDWILGGDDHERARQGAGDAVGGYLLLAHAFQQRGLCTRGSAVDLVGEEDVGEGGAGDELEPARLLVEDAGARDVAG